MEAYLAIVKELTSQFDEFQLTRIPRSENSSVDALAALGSASASDFRRVVPVEVIETPSIVPVD